MHTHVCGGCDRGSLAQPYHLPLFPTPCKMFYLPLELPIHRTQVTQPRGLILDSHQSPHSRPLCEEGQRSSVKFPGEGTGTVALFPLAALSTPTLPLTHLLAVQFCHRPLGESRADCRVALVTLLCLRAPDSSPRALWSLCYSYSS